jgi:hypothetical protein
MEKVLKKQRNLPHLYFSQRLLHLDWPMGEKKGGGPMIDTIGQK